MIPAEGTLERILLEALLAHPEGVTFMDMVGTGITEDNIDQVIQNLQTGMYISEDDSGVHHDA